ncbi:hypothetical protein BY996DRAFT_6412817 [Phakopsora pachyrhizi]|nr:hypothetical protein BY996DRAFT_6412817 [Phakopsora pachyrhizi]
MRPDYLLDADERLKIMSETSQNSFPSSSSPRPRNLKVKKIHLASYAHQRQKVAHPTLLCLAQIIGATAVIAARATAPNQIGPGNVFPDLGFWDPSGRLNKSPVANWEFWVALACQLVIVASYLVLFRRETDQIDCINNRTKRISYNFMKKTA